MRLHLIINVWKALRFLPMCLASLRLQTHTDWRAALTIDEAGSQDRECVQALIGGDSRFRLRAPSERNYVLRNTVEAIRESSTDPEDIIAILDGDDWLAREDALESIYHAHDRGAWVTYGSWVSNHAAPHYPSRLPPYPLDANLRRHEWLATAMRTFRRGLFDRIQEEDFQDPNGAYLRCCPDLAVMLPALEMAGPTRTIHIAKPIYFYNRDYGAAVADTRRQEQVWTAQLLRTKTPYPRIDRLS